MRVPHPEGSESERWGRSRYNDGTMERAGTGLTRIMGDVLRRAPKQEAPLLAWPLICGSKVAERTRAVTFSGGVLVVEVPDKIWRAQLIELATQYVGEFRRVLGRDTVEAIEFVIR